MNTTKNTTNIKHYFDEVLLPFLQSLQTGVQFIEEVTKNTSQTIQIDYCKNNTTEIFGFNSLDRVQMSLELYSKNEAACIESCYYKKSFTHKNANTLAIELNIAIRFTHEAVLVADTYGNVFQMSYNSENANENLEIFKEQVIQKLKHQVQVALA
jgi:hypothetical protein